ncbi:MAG: peptidase [Sphingobacteriaceae bacterium]|jgi:predicted Zn-dependent protease|nr:peptidase [Sphingobacteriaceae bacterium]
MKKYLLLAALTSSMLMIDSCATNPVTGKKQIVLMSEAQEIETGKEADPQVIAQYGLYEDTALQNFINEEGKKLAAVSHRPNLEYHYRIVDSEVVNAFAIPGGYVYFTRGIMAYFNNEAEFAGVLGHETGHITARHSVVQQRNQILGQIGLIAGMVLSPTLAQFGEQASQGLGLLFLKFSRDDERQADELGVEYSSKIGFDAHQMAEFFTTLERQSAASGEELPDFLSTHPNPGSRHTTVDQLATEWQQKLNLTNPVVNRNSYLKRIDGIIYGEDPKQGFLENNVFYHPVLKFQFSTPANWSYQNSPQAVQLAAKNGKALMMMTLAPGKTLQEAASATMQKYSLQPLQTRNITVNGLQALSVVADQVQQDQQGQQQQQQQAGVRTLSYFIQYGDMIYHLIGVSSVNDFNSYTNTFTNSFESFRELRDTEKLTRKPDRVRIKTINQNITLEQALRNYKITDKKKLDEYAILNGMKLNDKLTPGIMIKVVER